VPAAAQNGGHGAQSRSRAGIRPRVRVLFTPVSVGAKLSWTVHETCTIQEKPVPELSRFFGIIIAMYYNDHSPAHFHARYGSEQASIRIDNGEVVEGALGPRALRLVEEWRTLHQSELLDDWARARARQPLMRIEPLE
jgi:hypothetical protein